MSVPSPIFRIAAVRLFTRWPSAAVSCRLRDLAVVLCVPGTLLAGIPQTAPRLSANSDPVANLDALHTFADANSLANNLVADDYWIVSGAPAAAKEMDIGSADSAVGNLNLGQH